MRQLAGVLLLSIACRAADLAVLRNGFTIRHESRTQVGESTRLYTSKDRASFVDVPTADVERFDQDDAIPESGSSATRSTLAFPSNSISNSKASPQSVADAISSASHRYKLDPDFVDSVVSAESGFNSRARSRKGAEGLMQLMPGTASQLGVGDPFDPAQNAEGGTRYLRGLLERYDFDVPKALAAYNAGPTRVEQHHGVPPYRETRRYVARIINDYNRKKIAEGYGLHPNGLQPEASKRVTALKKAPFPARSQVAKSTQKSKSPRASRTSQP